MGVIDKMFKEDIVFL